MDLSVVIPCYNEADNVEKLGSEFFPVIDELAATRSVEVIFVDDGSTDATWSALNSAFDGRAQPGSNPLVRFEQHAVNRGLGAALRTGLTASRGQLVVTTDSDGTYRFTGIPEMLSYLTPDVDIVTASPYHPKGGVAGVPKYRLVLSQGASMMYRVLVDYRVYTYTALFRAYRRQVIDQIQFQSDGFLGGTELMVKAMLAGYRVTEYPAVLHRRVFGTSKAKLARTIKAHLRFQGKILLYRLHLGPLDRSVKTEEAQQWT
jgi:dolichol-phosphate mannosyltransferase